MKEIELSQGFVATVDDEDFQKIADVKWHASVIGPLVYARRNNQLMHRVILGITDQHVMVDHKDGNGLNNQKSNLRVCTQRQNLFNRRKLKPLSSKYKGVFFKENRYEAALQINGKKIYLGRFKNELDAAIAYNNKAKELFGEFARLNDLEME